MIGRLACVFFLMVLGLAWSPSVLEAGNSCATATAVSEGVYPFNLNTGTGDDPCNSGFRANWFLYTAPAIGTVTVETCGLAAFDTVMRIYDGNACPTTCSSIAFDDDACGSQSHVTFGATRGAKYLIMVRGFGGVVGTGSIRVSIDPLPGDTCQFAIDVSPNSSHEFNNASFSVGTNPCNPDSYSVWYTFVAPSAGTMRIDTCGSDFDTILQIFGGGACPATCNPIISNDDNAECELQAALNLPVTAGQRYYVSARGFLGAVGNGILNLAFTPAAGDSCAVAGVILGSGLYPYTTTGASADDPCAGGSFPSVWYRFMAPADGLVLARLNDTAYTPFLRVFSGASCPVGCSGVVVSGIPQNFPGGYLLITANAGATYHLSVSAWVSGNAGPGVLEFVYIPVGGDFNSDGVVNVADVTEFARMLDNGMPIIPLVGDFNNDASVDWDDVQALAELVAN